MVVPAQLNKLCGRNVRRQISPLFNVNGSIAVKRGGV